MIFLRSFKNRLSLIKSFQNFEEKWKKVHFFTDKLSLFFKSPKFWLQIYLKFRYQLQIKIIIFYIQTTYQPHLNFNSFFNPINPNYFNSNANLLQNEPIGSNSSILAPFELSPIGSNQSSLASNESTFNQSETFNYFPLKTNTDDGNNILTY